MILVYRPELDNPPMAAEATLGFSLLPKEGERKVDYIAIKSGVNRDVSEALWGRIKGRDIVQRLLKLGALTIQEEVAETKVPEHDQEHIKNVPLNDALLLVSSTFNVDQLRKWDAKDQRIKVKNAIAQRINDINEGKG